MFQCDSSYGMSMHSVVFLVSLLIGLIRFKISIETPTDTQPLVVASFNVKRFGKSKMSKPEVVDYLVRILQRYSLVAILEVVDKSEQSIKQLVEELSNSSSHNYQLLLSPRLGRKVKEQYAVIYRAEHIRISKSAIYPDDKDIFERDPFLVEVHTVDEKRILNRFDIAIVHLKPESANDEIEGLSDVIDHLLFNGVTESSSLDSSETTDNVLVMGDLNADCSYMSNKKLANNRMRQREDVIWWPCDDDDTSVANADCAYDRFIFYKGTSSTADISCDGEEDHNRVEAHTPLIQAISSKRVFRFDEEYGLSKDLARDISDHFPLELTLSI